ncbi:MAG: hypothetical protein KC613_00705, partial [Myxococcales bacterium]|nr:hypothetical protein [Myxococcales bacterium]
MWIEVSEKAAALLMSLGRVLLKGRTHKYIRRVPKPGGGYRYYYKTSGVTRSVKDDLAEGAKFRLTHEGQEGHFEVVGRSGDTVTLRHDESGGTMRVSAADLADLLQREHADVVQAQRERTAKRLAQARKTGTPKQIARMEAEAKRFGVETLSGDQKAELARIAVNERNASGGAGMTSAARIEKHKAAATAYRRKARGLPKGTLERARALNRAQDHAKMVKELEAPARFGETHRSRLLRHERLSEQSDMLFEDDGRDAAAAATVAQATAATHDAPVGPMDKKMAAAAKKAVALKRTGRAINFVEVVNGGRMGYAGRVVDGQPHTDDRTVPMLVLTRDVSDRSMADAIDKVAASGVASVLVVDSAGDIRRVAAPPIPAKRKAANEKALAAAA